MAQLDERGRELLDKIEENAQEAADEAVRAIENLGLWVQDTSVDIINIEDAAAGLAEAARLARKAADNQRRLDDL